MLVQLGGLYVIEALSLIGITRFKLKNEYAIPITVMSMCLILFSFGMLNILRAGVYFLLVLSIIAVGYTVVFCMRKKAWERVLSDAFTPAGIIFIVLYFALCYFNAGWLATGWDEFSHWADVVKAMSAINAFGTSSLSHCMFQSYPPAMSLFQYFFQVLYQIVDVADGFSEWRLIFAFQLYVVALLLPFVSMGIERNKSTPIIIYILRALIILLALAYFKLTAVLYSIYIDCFVAIVAATAIVHGMNNSSSEKYRNTIVFLSCAILVLSKDVGLYFAVFAATTNCITYFAKKHRGAHDTKPTPKPFLSKKDLLFLLLSAGCVAVPKLLWNLKIHLDNAIIRFESLYGIDTLLDVFLGKDTSYRSTVFPTFFSKLINDRYNAGDYYMPLSSVVILLLGGLFFILISKKIFNKKVAILYFITLVMMAVIYLVGLPITYIMKFSEYEATTLASLERYSGILTSCLWLVIILTCLSSIFCTQRYLRRLVVFFLIVFTCSGRIDYRSYISRENVRNALAERAVYNSVSTTVLNSIDEEQANICVIAQGSLGAPKYTYAFLLRPHTVGLNWSFGEEPLYDGDIYTTIIAPENFKQEILNDFDYVLISNADDYFTETYSGFFDDDIVQYGLYKVDKTAERCRFVSAP